MNDALEKLYAHVDTEKLNTFRKEFLAGLILVAFAFFFHQFIYTPGAREIDRLEAEAAGLRTQTGRLSAELREAENLGKTVEDAALNLKLLEQRLRSLKERIPSDRQVSRILDEITTNNHEWGTAIVAIKPLAPEDKGQFTRLPFQIEMEAGFKPFGDYIERIERLPRIMIVDNFLIESKEDTDEKLKTQMYLSAYILGPNQ